MSKVIIESPYAGDVDRNLRYARWCCRAVWELNGFQPLASHLFCTQYLDDKVSEERDAGILWEWAWLPGVPHWFFDDFGVSRGMDLAKDRCNVLGIPTRTLSLEYYSRKHWESFSTHTLHFS